MDMNAWWAHRQGLDGSWAGLSAVEVFGRAGWGRSVGGSAPYLTLFSRAGIRREAADAALERGEIQELPCARGCTYLTGAADYALALAVGLPFADDELKVARRLGVTDAEIAKLREAVAAALKVGALSTDEIKAAVGAAARSLGPDGVKKGITTTLPVALGLMQSDGEIRRVPTNGRIDQQRYRYALWKSPKWKKTVDEAFAELARKYFAWRGPAQVAAFQEFAGLGVKAAKAAVETLQLGDVGEGYMLLPEDAAAFRKFKAPAKPQYALVSNIDNMPIADAGELKAFAQSNRIFDRGKLVGRWEYDTATEKIVWASFVPRDKALEAAVKNMEAFIQEDLGDARGFSLDSPKSRVLRIEALRKA